MRATKTRGPAYVRRSLLRAGRVCDPVQEDGRDPQVLARAGVVTLEELAFRAAQDFLDVGQEREPAAGEQTDPGPCLLDILPQGGARVRPPSKGLQRAFEVFDGPVVAPFPDRATSVAERGIGGG